MNWDANGLVVYWLRNWVKVAMPSCGKSSTVVNVCSMQCMQYWIARYSRNPMEFTNFFDLDAPALVCISVISGVTM